MVKKTILAPALSKLGSLANLKKEDLGALPEKKDMLILHKTDEDKLRDADYLGGFASPSLAVVQENVPLSGFGNITLIGDPKRFDPKIRHNLFYS